MRPLSSATRVRPSGSTANAFGERSPPTTSSSTKPRGGLGGFGRGPAAPDGATSSATPTALAAKARKRIETWIRRSVSQLLLDPQQLVVLRHAVAPRRSACL